MFQGMYYVYEVYKEKSFSKAAQNLYISQPSLSATIKKVEERIGTPIFDRSTSPIRLTECGEKYIRCVENILDIQSNFENYLNDIKELKTGQINIGASNYFASFVLPSLIHQFTERYPFVKINLYEANTALLEERLFSGQLDLVLDNYTFHEDVYTRHFFCQDHLILVIPRKYLSDSFPSQMQLSIEDILAQKHIQPGQSGVDFQLLSDVPFLFLRSGNDTRKRSEQICLKRKFNPKIILKLDQQVTAYNLACYGMGATFISDNLIKNAKANADVIYCKIEGEEAKQQVNFYHKKTKYVTRAMEEFLKLAQEDINKKL